MTGAERVSGNVTLPRLLLRESVVILVAVAVIAALCWLYLLQLDRSMSDMAMPMSPRWTLSSLALTFFMWLVMMAGMMLPGATPMILTFAALRQRHVDGTVRRLAQTLFLVSGYLAVWSGVSLFATSLQCALDQLGLLSPMLATTSARLGSLLFLLAGLYQLTPAKHVCLRYCRSLDDLVRAPGVDDAGETLKLIADDGAVWIEIAFGEPLRSRLHRSW
jgi:predicted metal-binding membrane protein